MIAARIREIYDRQAKERQGSRTDIVANLPQCDTGKARDKAGEAVGVGGSRIRAMATTLSSSRREQTPPFHASRVPTPFRD
ncbi:hypothetical protein [Planctellipticum variicoloris]|uniref:hypothetical protein n=1 Tax=Planctellipticum variicoloris TaxID=3064265 RepID=UPI003013EAB9|nr:hypothetical protein SH412_003268 [Planctomycetaceae bacterium SH412]